MEAPGPTFAPEALGLGPRADEPWRAPRCVVVTAVDLLIVERSRLWVDSLHIQIVNRGRFSNPVPMWTVYIGQTFVSNTVVQGNGKNDDDSEGTCVNLQESAAGIFARGANPQPLALPAPIGFRLEIGMRCIILRGDCNSNAPWPAPPLTCDQLISRHLLPAEPSCQQNLRCVPWSQSGRLS